MKWTVTRKEINLMTTLKEYYKITPNEIYRDVTISNQEVKKAEVEEISFVVFPHVYPSHKFRTTCFLLKNLKDFAAGKKICDMGCGPGIIGLYLLHHGAESVVQVDINPFAVENAVENNVRHGFGIDRVNAYESDCFDCVPKNFFDLIIFNIPFHSDDIEIDDPLKYAFFDPLFTSVKKFLRQARDYSYAETQVIIAFSNKGDVETLEKIFTENQYEWELWKMLNADQDYDNRLYRLKLKRTE